jgi:hypothetical protein
MKRRPNEIRLSRAQQSWIYSTFGVLFLSGLWWTFLHFWGRTQGTFGEESSPFEPVSLEIHGAAAMVFLLVFGSLIPGHIRGGLLARKNFKNGISLVALSAILIVSGYLLYYSSGERVRTAVEWVHLAVGIAAVPALIWHVLAGRALARRRPDRTMRDFE